jgi:hypothetical protein
MEVNIGGKYSTHDTCGRCKIAVGDRERERLVGRIVHLWEHSNQTDSQAIAWTVVEWIYLAKLQTGGRLF